jgi:hypothetical protein
MAAEKGWKVDHLLGLSPIQDPFYAGMPSRLKEAQWFLGLWEQFDQPDTTHLRRFHYLIVSSGRSITLPDGSSYENTKECWVKLAKASTGARHLGLVDPLKFEDQRNPDPQIHVEYYGPSPEPGLEWPDVPFSWTLPSISSALAEQISLRIHGPEVNGYDYCEADQPYHLELWIEKSTMNDVLEPICRELHVNLVTGVGFMSITATIAMLRRVQRIRDSIGIHKPVRIFYISDFDPAGVCMPISVSRQAEFYLDAYAPGADIKLMALALTEEQVRSYDLPRIPIKDEDDRKGNFEDRRGEGAVELDALEALHPGELDRIVRETVGPFVNESLEEELGHAEHEAQDDLDEIWDQQTEKEEAERTAIEEEAREISKRYEQRAKELDDELQAELAPLKERITALTHAIATKMGQVEVRLPERPSGELDYADEETEWLFDSSRDYLEQAEAYRKFKKDASDPDGIEKVCERPECGARFKTRRKTNRFCSTECSQTFWDKERNKAKQERKAKRLGRDLDGYAVTCAVCGINFKSHIPNGRFCGEDCKKILRAREAREKRARKK